MKPKITLSRLNRLWRVAVGGKSCHGIKKREKLIDILTHFEMPIPQSESAMIRAVRGISGNVPKASKKPRSVNPEKKSKRNGSASFYSSWEWKRARYDALSKFGRRCMCCGWKPEDGGGNHLCVDHIKPRRHYPELALDVNNLQILCNDCNMGKGSRHEDDFRPSPQ